MGVAMRYGCKSIILFLSLILTANSSYGQYEPKRPATRAERPEISFDLRQTANGLLELSLKNNGTTPFRYYDSLTPQPGHIPYFATFRLCNRPPAECGGTEWISPHIMISTLIVLPTDMSELEPGGSMTKTVNIAGMLAMGGVEEPNLDVNLQVRVPIMITEDHDEYIEYVSDWLPVETLMPQ